MTTSDIRPPATSGSAHGRRRRALILTQAAGLFAERGFHAVGMGDIGAAAGVTGPAIYRHFVNKHAILVGLFDQVAEQLLERARAIVDPVSAGTAIPAFGDTFGAQPRRDNTATLPRLVAAHVDFALAERSLIKVYAQEAHNLPDPARSRLRRVRRLYIQEFVDVVADLRPDLSDAQVRLLVHAAFGLMNSVADHDPGIPWEDTAELLRSAALRTLLGTVR
ncbi:TetR/AcrR family transcriptional regulator [Yinghuangia sp. ASG 101]|uniref:TetR/AcrR family transcriptional regulator n=1 Tax=Yinghuangia sp. ASG 101 TaxID=2896848 RepID=UPI001E643897|nr:TetR/AcrR family transcriptional regulator [Yinghuangia sp. ASG 101]UGQ11911.1 TetR/AcrR family transcriptional regulator [Yinghuangia sp. ASG 101]